MPYPPYRIRGEHRHVNDDVKTAFGSLKGVQGPFASVYFDDSHDTADASERSHVLWRDLSAQLEDVGADEKLRETLEHAVLQSPPTVGRRGRGVIATAQHVLMNEHLLDIPTAVTVRVSDYPYVVPFVEHGMGHEPYVVAAVDNAGADIALHQGGNVSSTAVDGGGYPIHKVSRAGFSGYDDLQPRTEEAIRKNIRAVVEHLTELVDSTGAEVVFVYGGVHARGEVNSLLPERIAARVSQLHVGARHSHIANTEIDGLIAEELQRRRRAAGDSEVDRFTAESARGSGLAVEGLDTVCRALREGDADTLFVGELGDATVLVGDSLTAIAADPESLSELGQAARGVVRADEALPFVAITMGASLVPVHPRVSLVDGVGALMRYAVNNDAAPTAAGTTTN